MARITIRIDDEIFARLVGQARMAGVGTATFCRDILVRYEGSDPSGFHFRFDEIQMTAIQIFAILVAAVEHQSPAILQQGHDDARRLLIEKGYMDEERRA